MNKCFFFDLITGYSVHQFSLSALTAHNYVSLIHYFTGFIERKFMLIILGHSQIFNDCPMERRNMCNHPTFLGELCLASSINIIKTVRVWDLSILETLLEDSALSDLKIIALFRDPRAVHYSQSIRFKEGKDPTELCQRFLTYCYYSSC